jgi:CheY-like chemotaxis protein
LPLLPTPDETSDFREAAISTDSDATSLLEATLDLGGALSTIQETSQGRSEKEKATILIVDDNADVRAYLRTHLDADYHVAEAVDGRQGLESANKEAPDLVIADVLMPVMDGYELCRALKTNERLRSVPVLMVTAKAGEEDVIEGLESGADDYIAKPFSMSELKARIANLISGRAQMRRQFSREVMVRPAGIPIRSEDEVFLDRLLEVIDAHLGDSDFGVELLADEVGISVRHLRRRVEEATGEPPAELIRRFRLERARQLLEANAGTVAEVAYQVGFRSASHFSAIFRETYGVSPSEHAKARA